MKGTPCRRFDGVWHFTCHNLAFAVRQTEIWNRIEQHPSVRMLWLAEENMLGSYFTETAKIHDADIVGNVMDNGKIVADEKIGQSKLSLKFFNQVENLRLD